MSKDEYGKKYPGSGGATDRPRSGGAPWYPLPEGMVTLEPVTEKVTEAVTETHTEQRERGVLGRMIGLPPRQVRVETQREVERDVVIGQKVRKNYEP